MKNSNFKSANRSLRQGAALVVVLSCLVILTLVIVAFLASMRSSVVLSKSGSNANGIQILAETALNIAISQVSEATTKAGENRMAWASQPGMIRLYNNGGAAGYYKLYSWNDMVGTGAFDPFSPNDKVPVDWTDHPAIFTDLNMPVNGVYPIVDPSAIDPAPDVDGVGTSSVAIDEFTVTGAPSSPTNSIPMPVKWLYVLADGTLHVPDILSSGSRAVISSATSDNPIVGRIAFWTDDESCKVNINTASVALASTALSSVFPYPSSSYNTFWDTPHYSTETEYSFAFHQPAQGEYQRYPGHPASVGLNAIFPAGSTSSISDIFDLTPRSTYQGSKGGTVKFSAAQWIDRLTLADRLYSSVDELIFNAPSTASDRSAQAGITKEQIQAAKFFLTASSRASELNLFGLPRVSMWPVDSSITAATSNRVTILDRLLAFCSTIGSGATSQIFYFTRSNAKSSTTDIGLQRNLALLDYLDALTAESVPGYGADFQTKYTQPETRQILTEIFDYVRTTNTEDSLLPGNATNNPNWFAATPTTGWGMGRGQVVPSQHPGWNSQGFGSFWRPMEVSLQVVGMGDGPLSAQVGPPALAAQPGIPIPVSQIENPNVGHDPLIVMANINPADSSSALGWMPPQDTRAVQAFILVSFINPAHSRINGSSRMWIRILGLDQLKMGASGAAAADMKSLGFPATCTSLVGTNTAGDTLGTSMWFGYLPFTSLVGAGGYRRNLSRTEPDAFSFYSSIIPVPAGRANTQMSFSGGTITVEIYDISAGPNLATNPSTLPTGANKIQTLTVEFPPVSGLPLPGLSRYPIVGTTGTTGLPNAAKDEWGRHITFDRWAIDRKKFSATEYDGLDARFGRTLIDRGGITDKSGRTGTDLVQSMVLSRSWSDARLLARNVVPATAFSAHQRYGLDRIASSHLIGDGRPMSGHSGYFGRLVEKAVYRTTGFDSTAASFDNFFGNPITTPLEPGVSGWDWDTGIGNYPDGPWINKPDEGSIEDGTDKPYYQTSGSLVGAGTSFFSPNRQVSSPGMFGSLSSGVSRSLGWQTLLFRPVPASVNHPGAANPPDHLWMDLFWMPVVEPFAISEPFVTAGKINLNQQIVPFTYINRLTGLRAAIMGEKMARVNKAASQNFYKSPYIDTPSLGVVSRYPINLSESNGTLKQVREKFASGQIYKSATEICDIYLLPKTPGYSWPGFDNNWYGDDFAMVGDNMREKPYANIYGKLTTKSNVFSVHYCAQLLRVSRSKTDPKVFDPSAGGSVSAEIKGCSTFERYLDPNDPELTGLNIVTGLQSLEKYYRTRVVHSAIFNP